MTHCKAAVNYIFIIQVGACLIDKNNMIVGPALDTMVFP